MRVLVFIPLLAAASLGGLALAQALMLRTLRADVEQSQRQVRDLKEQIRKLERVKLVVARKSLNMGECVKDPSLMFELKEVDKGSHPPGAFVLTGSDTSLDRLKLRILKRSLKRGDSISLEDDTIGQTDSGGGWQKFPSLRAVSLFVTEGGSTPFDGWLVSKRVDVIITKRLSNLESSSQVMENVLVVNVDHVGMKCLVTFGLTPEQAMTAVLAKEVGSTFQLIYRSPEGTAPVVLPPLPGEERVETQPPLRLPPVPGKNDKVVDIDH
jgi:Flp pilus assembly protein CpaB